MERTTTNLHEKVNARIIVTCLTVFATIAIVISYILSFLQYNSSGNIELDFDNSSGFGNMLIKLLPTLLFLIFLLSRYVRAKAPFILSVVLLLICIPNIHEIYSGTTILFGERNYPLTAVEYIIFVAFIAIVVCLILAIVSALNGLKKKGTLIVALVLDLLVEVYYINSIISMLDLYLTVASDIKIISWLIDDFGLILLYVALLVFGIKNKIQAVFRSRKNIVIQTDELSVEEALKHLQNEYECNRISEDEYRNERAKIIDRL